MKFPMLAFSPIFKQERVQNYLKSQVEKRIKGPSEDHQKKARMELWGEVKKGEKTFQQKLEVPEGYHLTMLTALRSVEKVLAGEVSPGSYTPSMAFGSRFIEEFEGVKRL